MTPKKSEGKMRSRAYGTKTNYSEETLKLALQRIQRREIGQREATRIYNIPRQTLVNKLKGNFKGNFGRPKVFSDDEEAAFVQHCLALSDIGIPFSLHDLKYVIKAYLDKSNRTVKQFKNNMPGWEWGQSFIERHKSLIKEKITCNISRKRAMVNDAIIKEFFMNYEQEVEGVPPENIFNFDETGFHDIPSKLKLLFRRGNKNPEIVQNSTKSCYTVMFCGSAAGQMLSPYVVFKGKHKWTDWLVDAPQGTKINVSESGWMDIAVFDDWFENHFLQHAKNLAGKKVIIGDNLSSHISMKTLALCKENNISFVCLAPNSTHLLQPLDVACFSPLKAIWRKFLTEWRKTPDGKKKVALPKGKFLELLKPVLECFQEKSVEYLQKGFEKCGLFPVNCQRVLDALPAYAKEEINVGEKVGDVFKTYIGDIRANDLKPSQPNRKCRMPITFGKAVDLDEMKKYYDNKISQKSSKKQKTNCTDVSVADSEFNTEIDFHEDDVLSVSSTSSQASKHAFSGPKTRGGYRRRGSSLRTIPKATPASSTELNMSENILMPLITWDTPVVINSHDQEVIEVMPIEETVDSDSLNSMIQPIVTCDFLVGDMIAVSYEDKVFPGKIKKILNSGSTLMYKVSCMEKVGRHWKWPSAGKEDELWYNKDDIIKKLDSEPVKINKRGVFNINDDIFVGLDEMVFF